MKIKSALLSAFFTFTAVSLAAADERTFKTSYVKIFNNEQQRWEYEILKYRTLEGVLKERFDVDNVTIKPIRDEWWGLPIPLKRRYYFDVEISSNSQLYSFDSCLMTVNFSKGYRVKTINLFARSGDSNPTCLDKGNIREKLELTAPVEIHRDELDPEGIPSGLWFFGVDLDA